MLALIRLSRNPRKEANLRYCDLERQPGDYILSHDLEPRQYIDDPWSVRIRLGGQRNLEFILLIRRVSRQSLLLLLR